MKGMTDYQKWVEQNRLTEQDIASAHQKISSWQIHPKFSVITPVYNVEGKWLEKAIESVLNQIYPFWELCIADDASPEPHIRSILNHYSQLDKRIKVVFRQENGNISAASNSALELATGDYIALLDHDDELTIDALFENAKLINQHPNVDFIYSDEDKIDTEGNRYYAFFKPDWSPEYFYSCMYTSHLGVYRTSLIREIGGFRSEYNGSQDYDLVLRVIEKTKNIHHIPKILYHWRSIPSSAASSSQAKPWAYTAAKNALQAMLERSPYPGHVEELTLLGFYGVRRDIIGQPLVSIIIPSAGKRIFTPSGEVCLLENCIRSIEQQSTYRNYEIIVVDGYDIPESTIEAISSPNVQIVRSSEPFNFSMRINIGAAKARGEFLLLLNDDTQVITPDWMKSMLELAQQKEIGAVGAKLLFPDQTIQHVGVIIAEGNPIHAFYGFDSEKSGYYGSNIVIRNYLAVTGACLMMRLEVFQQLGGLDEEFPLNYNDVDLCLKAHQAGYRNVVTPYAQLVHYESASRPKGIEPGELPKFQKKWNSYLRTLGEDPYYPTRRLVGNGDKISDLDEPTQSREKKQFNEEVTSVIHTINKFSQLYYYLPIYNGKPTWQYTYWMGLPTLRCPLDLWLYQEIIHQQKPDFIVECGVAFGGTTAFLADTCKLIGLGKIIAVDSEIREQVRKKMSSYDNIHLLEGNSVSQDIVNQIFEIASGKNVLVILGGDRTKNHVLQELNCYSKLVKSGRHLIVEATNINGHPVLPEFGPGPMEAVEEFLQHNSDFYSDEECHKSLITFNPKGYLKRR